jgi:hypothetical protein
MLALESLLWQAGALMPPPSTCDGGPLDDDFPVPVEDLWDEDAED